MSALDPSRRHDWSWGNSAGATSPSPAIMKSLESLGYDEDHADARDDKDDRAINGNDATLENRPQDAKSLHAYLEEPTSFLLIDGEERLRVSSAEQFHAKLRCPSNTRLKVVSIFGNTGDGKSHTLNRTFFEGAPVFRTSNEQSSCTLGVWAAFDPGLNVICLDTEGLLGVTIHENERTRLLLKVLAISDIVVYRTRSERLHRDLFTFLGAASRAYSHHFQAALQALGKREGVPNSSSALGPSVIVFHETRYTRPLANNASESAEDVLRSRFAEMQLEIEAFSSIKYVGVQTSRPPTDYEPVRCAVRNELENTTVRSARKPSLVYGTLRILNDKFSGEITGVPSALFPDQYFTCPVKCLSCSSRCNNSMGHVGEGKPHTSDTRCRYQHQYENVMYVCKRCHSNGNEVVVSSRTQSQSENGWYGLARYAWSGYVIECPHCGEIYRSRQYWYGNKSPEDDAVRTEINHVWNISNSSLVNQNTAQRVIDGVTYITEAVASASLQPTKAISAWVADQVAPSYWRPNNEIKHCHTCSKTFGVADTKHHCRACGEGFCAKCSSRTIPVPARKWYTPVRVCDACYAVATATAAMTMMTTTTTTTTTATTKTTGTTGRDGENENESGAPRRESTTGHVDGDNNEAEDVSVRKVTEHVVSTLSAVGTVLTYSKSLIKDTVRPSYWVPDSELTNCCVCDEVFSDQLPLHHCRSCGRGVCQNCSQHRKPVLRRGWEKPVRVCDQCVKID